MANLNESLFGLGSVMAHLNESLFGLLKNRSLAIPDGYNPALEEVYQTLEEALRNQTNQTDLNKTKTLEIDYYENCTEIFRVTCAVTRIRASECEGWLRVPPDCTESYADSFGFSRRPSLLVKTWHFANKCVFCSDSL